MPSLIENTTLTATDTAVAVDASAGPVTLTLSLASLGSRHFINRVDNVATNAVTIVVQGGNSIDGLVTYALGVGKAKEFISDKLFAWISLSAASDSLASTALVDVLNEILNQLKEMR